MKSITNYITDKYCALLNEKQSFLIKGHTKDQSNTVDLDLPSGTRWATCNIGANKPENYGLYFQFGRVDGYKYNDKHNKFLSITDYVTSSGTKYKMGDTLKSEDDAAYQATNGRYRMPTADELNELVKYTDNKWTELNGVKGRKFISKKDESKWIFIPAAGFFSDSFLFDGSIGGVWSASVRSDNARFAYYLNFSSGKYTISNNACIAVYSVRGVLNK